jgi:hypothetical protein
MYIFDPNGKDDGRKKKGQSRSEPAAPLPCERGLKRQITERVANEMGLQKSTLTSSEATGSRRAKLSAGPIVHLPELCFFIQSTLTWGSATPPPFAPVSLGLVSQLKIDDYWESRFGSPTSGFFAKSWTPGSFLPGATVSPMDLDDDLSCFAPPQRVYIERMRHDEPSIVPLSCPSSISLILSDGVVTPSRLNDVILDFEDNLLLPGPFIDLLFNHLSDPRSVSPDFRSGILSILKTWAQGMLETHPDRFPALLPRDAVTVLELWIPDPLALHVLALVVSGSRSHAILFATSVQCAPDQFASSYSMLLRSGHCLPVLDLALALSQHAEVLVPLTPLVLDILAFVPNLPVRGLRKSFALFGHCCRDTDCLSSLINSGRLAPAFGLLCGDARLMRSGLPALTRIVCTLGPERAFAFVRTIAFWHLWSAAMNDRNEEAIEEICFVAGVVCFAGAHAVRFILRPSPSITGRLLALHQCVAFRTWRAIVDLISIVVTEGTAENATDLVAENAVLAICEVLAAADIEEQDGRTAEVAQKALARIAELVEEGRIPIQNLPNRQELVSLADEETEMFNPINRFIARIDAFGTGSDHRRPGWME